MSRPNVRADASGPGIYRFLLGDACLRCSENIHDDDKFAQSALYLREMAGPIIKAKAELWGRLRDGDPKTNTPGFWTGQDGQPLRAGDFVPKEAYRGLVGAIVEILYEGRLFWSRDQQHDPASGLFQDALSRSKLGQMADEGEAEAQA